MTRKIKWGILGLGNIATQFASDLRLVKEAELYAVASRSKDRGIAFAEKFGAQLVFKSYEDLVSSDVDVVYIATPHSCHYEHTLLCLEAKKPVLVEKPFAINSKQAKHMAATAKTNGVFLMEAFWTKFLPQYRKVIELLNAGAIGHVTWMQGDFGFKAADPVPARLWDPLLGGGALLDIGIYPLFMAQSLFGKPEDIQVSITPFPSGTDQQCGVMLRHKNNVLSMLSSTFAADTPIEFTIAGTKGVIRLSTRFYDATSRVMLTTPESGTTEIEVYREDGMGYQFEAQHVTDCLIKNLTESPVHTLQDSLDLMETLDLIRAKAGIRYVAD